VSSKADPRLSSARAVVLLLVHGALLLLATPGLDSVGKGGLSKRQRADGLSMGFPPWVIDAVDGLSGLNAVRVPMMRVLTPLQRPLRLGQSWNLYGNGPMVVRRMEIVFDDALVYRSGDPDLDWFEPALRNRRMRPVIETAAEVPKPRNRLGLARLVVEKARASVPTVQRVELRFTVSDFPGGAPVLDHSLSAAAPDWTVESGP
jgi:hypothetical protein